MYFRDMNIQIYQSIHYIDEEGYGSPLFINNDTLQYISVEYLENISDWNYSYELNESDRNVYHHFEAQNCSDANFMINTDLNFEKSYAAFLADPSNYNSKHFSAWEGYSLICPKINEKIKLKGTQ